MTLYFRYPIRRAVWLARFRHPLMPISSLVLQPLACRNGHAVSRHKPVA